MKYRHSHPINILEHTSNFLILLVFPVLRALFFTGFDFKVWLGGAWFDLATIAVIILMGVIGWVRYEYCLSNQGIYIQKGIFIIRQRFIPYEKLSVLSAQYPLFFRPIHAVRVRADTDGGFINSPDFEITIRKSQYLEIEQKATAHFSNHSDIKRVYLPKNFFIAVMSFVVSNTLTGVIFVSTLISGTGKVLGKEAENVVVGTLTDIATKLAFGLPPIAAILGLTLLGGWAVSFSLNLIRHLRFCVTRQAGNLKIKHGIFTLDEWIVMVKRINLIELRQTLTTKIFGLYTASIHSSGYGKKKDVLSILIPAGSKKDILQNLRLLLPEIPISKPTIRPTKRYLSRFLIPPIGWNIAIFLSIILANFLFPQFHDMILFFGIMTQLPCLWYLFVKIISFFHTGIGVENGVYTMCYTYGYRIKTVAVPQKKVVKLTIRRSLFQFMSGCCDVVILTFSEGRKRHVVPNLNYEQVKKMVDYE